MREETVKHAGRITHDRGLVKRPRRNDPPLPPVSLLALQFLAWVAVRPRTHADVMDAWRSTCPRQSVWEDTVIDGLVRFAEGTNGVVLSPLGRAVLRAHSASQSGHG